MSYRILGSKDQDCHCSANTLVACGGCLPLDMSLCIEILNVVLFVLSVYLFIIRLYYSSVSE